MSPSAISPPPIPAQKASPAGPGRSSIRFVCAAWRRSSSTAARASHSGAQPIALSPRCHHVSLVCVSYDSRYAGVSSGSDNKNAPPRTPRSPAPSATAAARAATVQRRSIDPESPCQLHAAAMSVEAAGMHPTFTTSPRCPARTRDPVHPPLARGRPLSRNTASLVDPVHRISSSKRNASRHFAGPAADGDHRLAAQLVPPEVGVGEVVVGRLPPAGQRFDAVHRRRVGR